MSGRLMKRVGGAAMMAVAMVSLGARASEQASPSASAPDAQSASRGPVMVEMKPALSTLFIERFPDLGMLNGLRDIPLPEVPDAIAERVSASRKITLVVYPAERRQVISNNYLIYTAPCDADASRSCHYLGVMTQFGMPIQRMYGPVDLDAKPALELKLSGA